MKNYQNLNNKGSFKINNKFSKKQLNLFWPILILIILISIVVSFLFIDNQWLNFFTSIPNIFQVIRDMFLWDWKDFTAPDTLGNTFLAMAFNSVWVTITLSIVGTVIGVAFAIPFAILSSSSVVQNKFINGFCKSILAILRTIPSFTFALILIGYFGQSTLTVTIAISIFTFARSGKMLYERIEQINIKLFTSMQATGANKALSFKAGVLPQISHHILFTAFYTLETNVKYISIIGAATSTGIGVVIEDAFDLQEWGRMGFSLTLLVSMVLILETLMFLFRIYIMQDKDYFIDQKYVKKISKKYDKLLRLNNKQFYLNYILCKEINEKIKNTNNKLDKQKLILKKDKIKTNFYNEYNKSIKSDKINYKQAFFSSPIKDKLFVFNEEYDLKIRLDQVSQTIFNFKVNTLKEELAKLRDNEILATRSKIKKSLTVNGVLKKNPKNWIKKVIVFLGISAFAIYSFTLIDFQLANSESIHQTNLSILEIFNINWKTLFGTTSGIEWSVFSLLLETLSMAIVGTFLGAIFAYILGILSSSKITNLYFAKFILIITTIMRSIPSYIFAFMIAAIVPMGTFAGVMALASGTIWSLSKYVRESFDDINMKLVYQLQAVGFNKWQVFRYGVIPQTTSPIFTYIIFKFDGNFRDVAILGSIGAGNMGLLLNSYFENRYFPEFGALMLGIILLTLLVEYCSNALRSKILFDKNLLIYDKLNNLYRQNRFAWYKANERIHNTKYKMSYNESRAFFSYTNARYEYALSSIFTNKNIVKDKSNLKLREKVLINIKYITSFVWINPKSKLGTERIYFINKRKKFVHKLKLKKDEDIAFVLNKLKLTDKNDLNWKIFKKEANKNIKFIKKSYNIQYKNIEY